MEKDMAKTKTKKVVKPKRLTMKEAKMEASRLGLVVAAQYDKRFINTWLHTIGEDVEPVLRTSIVHKPKKKKKQLSWADLADLAEA